MDERTQPNAFRSPLFASGLALYAADLVLAGSVYAADPEAALRLAAAFAAFLAGGKLVGVSTGVALGGDPWTVAALIALADVGTVFVLYPFTDAGLDRLGRRFHRIGRSLERARRRGERREGLVARYGPWGLFLVTMMPAGYYSPVVVATFGHVLGLRPLAVLTPVGVASAVSTLAYALLLDAGYAHAARIEPWIPWAATIGLLVLLPLGKWVWRRCRVAPETGRG